jgi:hypothetical protein
LKLSFDECKSRLLTRVDANSNATDALLNLLYYSSCCLL